MTPHHCLHEKKQLIHSNSSQTEADAVISEDAGGFTVICLDDSVAQVMTDTSFSSLETRFRINIWFAQKTGKNCNKLQKQKYHVKTRMRLLTRQFLYCLSSSLAGIAREQAVADPLNACAMQSQVGWIRWISSQKINLAPKGPRERPVSVNSPNTRAEGGHRPF